MPSCSCAPSERSSGILQEVFDRENILHRLMSAAAPSDAELRPKVQRIAAARQIPEERVCAYLKDMYRLSLPSDRSGCQNFCQKMRVMIKQFEAMSEVELDTHAAHGAECSSGPAQS